MAKKAKHTESDEPPLPKFPGVPESGQWTTEEHEAALAFVDGLELLIPKMRESDRPEAQRILDRARGMFVIFKNKEI